MTTKRKLLLTLLTVSVVGSIAGFGVFSAFTSQTDNPGNSFAAGTVHIEDNDGGDAMYNPTNQKPGQTTTKCIKVTYGGSLDSDVKLFTPSTVNSPPSQYVDLTITPGTQTSSTFPDCTGFSAEASGPIYDDTLAGFASSHNSYANGLADNPGASTKWGEGDTVVYRFEVSVQDNNAANKPGGGAGYQTGAHTYRWEARNQ